MADDFSALIRVKLDESSIGRLNSEINNLATQNRPTVPIRIALDQASYNTVRKQIDELYQRMMRMSQMRIQLGGGKQTNFGQDSIKQAYNDLIMMGNSMKAITELMGRVDVGSDKYRELDATLNQVFHSYETLFNMAREGFSSQQIENLNANLATDAKEADILTAKLSMANDEFSKMSKLATQIGQLQSSLTKLAPDTEEYSVVKNQMDALVASYRELQTLSQGNLNAGQLTVINEKFEEASRKAEVLAAHIGDIQAKAAASGAFKSFMDDVKASSNIQVQMAKLDTSTNTQELKELNAQLEIYQERISAYLTAHPEHMGDALGVFNQTEDAIRRINAQLADKRSVSEFNANWKELVSTVQQIGRLSVKQVGLDPKKNAQEYAQLSSDIGVLQGRYQGLVSTMGKLPVDKQKELDALLRQNTANVEVAKARYNDLGSSIARLGNAFKSSFFSAAMYMFSGYRMFQTITNAVRSAYRNIVEIDSAMTELRKVTDETNESYSRFLQDAGKNASEIGSTVTDYINSTADFARLGHSFADSQELAKVANVYSVVGDDIDSIDEASQSIISTMAAFGVEAKDAMSIVDKFNEVGK